MKIHLFSLGHRSPAWLQQGFEHYSKQMPRGYHLLPHHVLMQQGQEAQANKKLLALFAKHLRQNDQVVALKPEGQLLDNQGWVQNWTRWQQEGMDVAFMVGAADGLLPAQVERAGHAWSLSPLVLPHHLARLVLTEQIYRTLCLVHNHPYPK